MTIHSSTMETPAGPFSLVVNDDGVLASGFTADIEELWDDDVAQRRSLGEITDAVLRYFRGDVATVDGVPAACNGTPLLREAWEALRLVPAGTTVTYTELATKVGRPAAVRAAGAACARNKVALIVPCHRVIRSDGSLGGYRWGLPVKRWLLAHEAANAMR